MKNIKFYIIIATSVILFSCKDNLAVWSDDTARIQFLGDTLQAKTFIFDTPNITIDTILLEVQAIGKASSVDRPFIVKQVEVEGAINAEEGVHYLSLNSEEIKKYLVIKANESKATIPIIINRASLTGLSCVAKFDLIEANDFFFGEMKNLTRKIIMSNMYEKPTLWNKVDFLFGKYSKVKHEFMHRILADKSAYIPDDVFFNISYAEIIFYSDLMKDELKKHNATLDKDPNLDEDLRDENGDKVVF